MSSVTVPETIDVLYAEAYALIDQGICFDEVGHIEGAKTMYERGLALIERAGKRFIFCKKGLHISYLQ